MAQSRLRPWAEEAGIRVQDSNSWPISERAIKYVLASLNRYEDWGYTTGTDPGTKWVSLTNVRAAFRELRVR